MPRTAIGYLRHDCASPADLPKLRDLITRYAQAHGLHLASTFEAEPDHFMPLLVLLEQYHLAGAEVIIAPTAEHVWSARRAITLQADMAIAAPGEIYAKGIQWAPWTPNEGTAPTTPTYRPRLSLVADDEQPA
ncbi:hypothetical protein [Nocardia farcinica]|uniref:hypothetical protein n=1 Tax=Nocardia farcinica TaxID=37329 RepID=UPI002454D398|nr:hypothetical protein [Nocardia farcinica]